MTGPLRPAALTHAGAMETKALNILATIRQQKASWTPGVLGLFVFVWLNLALQPCAMAMDSEHEHDCPRCPPAHQQSHQHDQGQPHHLPSKDVVAGGDSCPGVMSCAEDPGGAG